MEKVYYSHVPNFHSGVIPLFIIERPINNDFITSFNYCRLSCPVCIVDKRSINNRILRLSPCREKTVHEG